ARHLESHIIADDVCVEDQTAGWLGLSLVGAGTGAWLAAEARPGLVFSGRRDAGENWEWIHPAADSASAGAAVAGARMLDRADVERMRIASGIPSVPADIGPSDLPNEGGLEAAAISYSKGCYTGQEVMARLRSMGRVRRTLVRVKGGGPPPAVPAALWGGGKRQGELRSAVAASGGGGFEGLALLASAAGPGAGPLSLGERAAPTVEVARDP
ncbi:MAG TPA: tRNA-modifying protein YgfZ, partial [Opitutaceae bacterium]|nr:tRNA-modifying protein YgfZ [Opitutaceae bacterium]